MEGLLAGLPAGLPLCLQYPLNLPKRQMHQPAGVPGISVPEALPGCLPCPPALRRPAEMPSDIDQGMHRQDSLELHAALNSGRLSRRASRHASTFLGARAGSGLAPVVEGAEKA